MLTTREEILAWLKERARALDNEAHGDFHDSTLEADRRRTAAWNRAVTFYEIIEKIEGTA